jgi:hypothetical protein
MSCQNRQLQLGGATDSKKTFSRNRGGNAGGIGIGEVAIPASFFMAKRLYTRKINGTASKYGRIRKYKKSRRSGRRSRRY